MASCKSHYPQWGFIPADLFKGPVSDFNIPESKLGCWHYLFSPCLGNRAKRFCSAWIWVNTYLNTIIMFLKTEFSSLWEGPSTYILIDQNLIWQGIFLSISKIWSNNLLTVILHESNHISVLFLWQIYFSYKLSLAGAAWHRLTDNQPGDLSLRKTHSSFKCWHRVR